MSSKLLINTANMKGTLICLFILLFFLINNISAQNKLPRIKVSENKRFLCLEDGKPFFWLGDTAWELFLKLTPEESELYFSDRKSKGFNLIQITILSENDHHTIDATNHMGFSPLLNQNPATPDVKPGENNDYWDHVDRVIKLAESKGLYIGLLPTWSEYVTTEYRDGVVNSIFNVNNAFVYGKFVGERYKNFTNIIWILGGDRSASSDDAKNVWRAMARGLATGITGHEDYSQMLMTYHPVGQQHSTDDFPNEPWIDFNAIQSGHGSMVLNWEMVQEDYKAYNEKPIIDLESCYPFIATCGQKVNSDDYAARRAAYWSVFSGSFGHTYGHHGIWNFVTKSENPNIIWKNAINAVSSTQMGYLKELMESFPFFERIPDQSIISSNPDFEVDHIAATRGENYVLIYLPNCRPVVVQMGKIKGQHVNCKWFNPRNNKYQEIGTIENNGLKTFTPPKLGKTEEPEDWVLVLETK